MTMSKTVAHLGHRLEALELALRAQSGSLTTAEQTRLGVVSAEEVRAKAKHAAADAAEDAKQELRGRLLAKQSSAAIERTWRTTYLVEKIRVRMIKEQKNSNSWQAVPKRTQMAIAEAVLREVAEWLRSEYPQREGYGTAWANLLDNEANL